MEYASIATGDFDGFIQKPLFVNSNERTESLGITCPDFSNVTIM